MRTDELRKTFSKAAICTSDNVITAEYSYKGLWFSQSVEGRCKEVLIELLGRSHGLVISRRSLRTLQIVFHGDFGIHSRAVYNPMSRERTPAEIEAKLAELRPMDPYGIQEALKGVDSSDINLMLSILAEKLQEIDFPQPEITPESCRTLNKMTGLARNLKMKPPFIFNVEPPGNGTLGLVEIQAECLNRQIYISGKSKETLMELIKYSSVISINGCAEEGAIIIEFYV